MNPALRRTVALASSALALALLAPSAALAVPPPDCAGTSPTRVIFSGQGRLESVIADRFGRLYFTATDPTGAGKLMKAGSPTAPPRVLAEDLDAPGGMVFDDGQLLVGRGNSIANGSQGDENPVAELLSVDLKTGVKRVFARGLGMANGVARSPDGTIFASNDFGSKLDRIAGALGRGTPGTVTHGFAEVETGNGMAVDRAGKFLYVNQTFTPTAAIQRVEIANPSRVKTFASVPGEANVTLDGMTRDRANNLYVAALGRGQVWRVDTRGRICVVAGGLSAPSALAFGRGDKRFSGGNLYVVSFGGEVVEIPGANRTSFPG